MVYAERLSVNYVSRSWTGGPLRQRNGGEVGCFPRSLSPGSFPRFMEARGIEPHTSANRKYLNAQDARIQALGPGSLPALCAFSALGALGKGQIRHNGDQSANSLCSSLAPDVTNQLNPPGAFTNWPCRGTPRRAVTCCASVGLPETTSTFPLPRHPPLSSHIRLTGGGPLSSHSFRKCSSVPRQPIMRTLVTSGMTSRSFFRWASGNSNSFFVSTGSAIAGYV